MFARALLERRAVLLLARALSASVSTMQAIAQLRYTEAKPGPLELLREALEDTHLQCRVRMEAANALAALRDDDGRPVGEWWERTASAQLVV